jgi:TRIAD3 protein (E3 ubiquitin-protein ligase RNF216)
MAHPRVEYVDIDSDSEDEGFLDDGLQHLDAELDGPVRPNALHNFSDDDGLLDMVNDNYNQGYGAGNEVIDLTNIPDIDVPPSDGPIVVDDDPIVPENGAAQLVTEAACLQMVMDVLPDISTDHVLNLIKEKTTDLTRTLAQCENILTQLLDGEAYPKEVDEANTKKRKRDDEDDWSRYEKGERDPDVANYEQEA